MRCISRQENVLEDNNINQSLLLHFLILPETDIYFEGGRLRPPFVKMCIKPFLLVFFIISVTLR